MGVGLKILPFLRVASQIRTEIKRGSQSWSRTDFASNLQPWKVEPGDHSATA